MIDFKKYDLDTLMDMLSQHTKKFMKLFRDGAPKKEYLACKEMMGHLTREIETRKLDNRFRDGETPEEKTSYGNLH